MNSSEYFIVGMKAHRGNPYDGHTGNTVLQVERNTGLKAKEIYVDLGYRWLN